MGFLEATTMHDEADSGHPSGKMYRIACKTWFTASGKSYPLSFKFKGDDGTMQMVSNIKVLYEEDKNYSGIPSREYGCEAVIGGLMHEFRLVFYCEACLWVMMDQEP